MNIATMPAADAPQPIGFSGRLSSFAGLAIGNLLLTIVTIGVYRFWAKTRVRRHLWARTSFMGDALEYRGRGIEKFLGAALVFLVVFVPLFILSGIAAALTAAHQFALVGLIYVAIYFGLIYLFGVGGYRAQRYVFSRTAWRGIRGGMRGRGWSYGLRFLKLLLLQVVTLGFALPFVSTRLWNARMNDAMFGSVAVVADAEWRPLYRRFLVAWLGSLVIYVILVGAIIAIFGSQLAAFRPGAPPPADPKLMFGLILRVYGIAIVGGIAIALLMLGYHAALLRELFGKTRLGTLGFQFDATAADLLKFTLGNFALIVLTIGLGTILMPYRVWSFYVRHLSTTGVLDVDALLQTDLVAPIQGDGLADAFDTAAF